jgi:hypothetical protein
MIPKLKTAKEREEKERRSRLIMTVFVVVLLGASTVGYALMQTESSERVKYNDFTFIKTENGWNLKKTSLFTSYLPQDVENISIKGSVYLEDFNNKAYVIALGNEEKLAATELLSVMPLEQLSLACLPEHEDEAFCEDLPLKECEDAISGNIVIIFSQENESSISYEDYCLTIKGEDLTKASDRVIFELYEII